MDINTLTVTGRLTSDAELKRIEKDGGEFYVCTFTLACNYLKNKDALFLRCKVFGKFAEAIHEYLTKGRYVAVTGNLNVRNVEYEDGWKTFVECLVRDVSLGLKQG